MQITQSISGKIRNLSFVSAVLVVMIHAPYLPSVVRWAMSERICSVAVPCFFAISGFLLYVKTEGSGWWRRETLKRVRTLLIPNLLVNLAYFPFVYLYRNGGVGEAHSNLTMQLRLVDIAGALGLDPTVPSACGPTWFLRNLFLLVLISPVLVFLLRRSVRSFIAVLLLAFAVYAGLLPIHRISSSSSWHYFISSGFSARGLLFFSLGLLAASLQFRPLPKWFSLGCLFLGGFLVLMGGQLQTINLCSALGTVSLLVGIVCVIPALPFPAFLTRNSFFLYAFHIMAFYAIKILVKNVGCSDQCLILMKVFSLPVVILSVICIGVLFRKVWPAGFTVLTGGR